MFENGIFDAGSIRQLADFNKPEKRRQYRVIGDPEFAIRKILKLIRTKNSMTSDTFIFQDNGRVSTLKEGVSKMTNENIFKVLISPDAKTIISPLNEMKLDPHGRGKKSTRDKHVLKRQHGKIRLSTSGLAISFPYHPDGTSDRLCFIVPGEKTVFSRKE